MSASSRIRHSPFSFGRRVEELVFYGSWRLQGAVPDMRVVASDASVRSEERVVDIHMAVDNFGKSHPNLVGKRWVLSLATERARDAAKRVYVRDGISGAEISLDEMVAHLGETVPAAAFLQTDKAALVAVALSLVPSASVTPGVALDDTTVVRLADRLADVVRESLKAQPKPVVVRDIGLTKEASAQDLVYSKGISKSQATKYLRIIVGRRAGTGETLRAPVGEVERYFAAGCPATWNRSTWRAGR